MRDKGKSFFCLLCAKTQDDKFVLGFFERSWLYWEEVGEEEEEEENKDYNYSL